MKPRKLLGYSDAPYSISLMKLIETQSKPTIVKWCVDYSELFYLPVWQKHAPDDQRPVLALEAARKWLAKEVKCQDVRNAAWDSHLAAKDAISSPAAEAAARAIANAALTVHVATHSIRMAYYGAAAVAYDKAGCLASQEALDALAEDEFKRLSEALLAVSVENEPNPAEHKWSDMNNIKRMP
ncbi:MAG: hypothetical protein LBT59_20315 [Clostridiales bacterium]|jgi:hypothetical protein|nr:hypothetical protein [Clostridiales bacterium]